VAKVTRDTMMIELARAYPDYGFERHKGYATPEHQAAIERLGVTPQHRRSFKTVQLALGLGEANEAPAADLPPPTSGPSVTWREGSA
jgi:ribonuclease HII